MNTLSLTQPSSPAVFSRASRLFIRLLLASLAVFTAQSATAETYTLGIQPVLPEKEVQRNYAPLANYLAEATGQSFVIKTTKNFFSYWTQAQRGDFDLTLDGAHFAGYHAKHQGYEVLAKIADEVSYSLVTTDENQILDPQDLVGKPVATLSPPSLGALRLEQWFANPMREPLIRVVDSTPQAIADLRSGRVVAAMIPTPMVSRYDFLTTVQTTDTAPHMAISAKPTVPMTVREAVRNALVNASASEQGQAMLADMKLNGFESADIDLYLPYATLLEQGRLNVLQNYIRPGVNPSVNPSPGINLAGLPARK